MLGSRPVLASSLGVLTIIGAASQLLVLPLLFLVPNYAAYHGRDAAPPTKSSELAPSDGEKGMPSPSDDLAGATTIDSEDDDTADEATAQSTPLLHASDDRRGKSGAHAEPLTGAIVLTTLLVLGTSFSVGEVIVALVAQI